MQQVEEKVVMFREYWAKFGWNRYIEVFHLVSLIHFDLIFQVTILFRFFFVLNNCERIYLSFELNGVWILQNKWCADFGVSKFFFLLYEGRTNRMNSYECSKRLSRLMESIRSDDDKTTVESVYSPFLLWYICSWLCKCVDYVRMNADN